MHLNLNIPAGSGQFIQAFSWMLIHSLWQGLLLAVVAAILMQVSKNASARLRYTILFTLFSLFVAGSGVTFIYELNGATRTMVPLAGAIGHNASQLLNWNAAGIRSFADACTMYISTHALWLVLVWMICFAFRSFRIMQGLLYLQKARNEYTCKVADWQERITVFCNRLQINSRVRLLESAFVKVPMVIGYLKPVILMPAGLLTGLPAEQVEAVLLHELAHIRRRDYLVNMLQNFCEAVFFFNPGMLWISSLLRDEREHCCDDIALEQTGNKGQFIQALISFKEHALYAHNAAVAFPGKKHQLLNRVSRIIDNKNKSLERGEKVFVMAGILFLSAVLLTAGMAQLSSMETEIMEEKPAIAVFNTRAFGAGMQLSEPVETDAAIQKTLVKKQVKLLVPVAEPTVISDEPVSVHIEITATQSQQVVEETTTTEEAACGPERAGLDKIQVEKSRQQAALDRIQADKDRQQADRDRAQAMKDREQAAKDREQARLDRIQAEKDRKQADKDREQAVKNREQAVQNRLQAVRDKENYLKAQITVQ